MDQINLGKLTTAIKLILYNQLKENADDSYSHKLVDLVDLIKLQLALDDLKKLMQIIQQALSHEVKNGDVDLSTGFKLLGVLISDERIINDAPDTVTNSFKQIEGYFDLLKDEEKPFYNLQYSFLECITKLCSTKSGCLWLVYNDDLLLIIFHLLTKSQGFYVQMEAQSVIIILMKNVLDDSDASPKLEPFLHQMLLMNCKPYIECLKSLVQFNEIRVYLNKKFKLDHILLSKIDTICKHDSLLPLYCEILAACVSSQESVNNVTQCLLENKKLKPLIVFFSSLVHHHNQLYINGWFLYIVYPFIANCENTELLESIEGDIQIKLLIKKLTTKKEIMAALQCIDVKILTKLNERDCLLLLDCLACFLQDNFRVAKDKKIIAESLRKLNFFWNLPNNRIIIQHSLEVLLQLLDDFIGQERFEILKSIREIIDKHLESLDHQTIIDVCAKSTELLDKSTIEQDFELADSVLEVIISITHNTAKPLSEIYPDFIEKFLDYWVSCLQASNDSNLIASCIPILMYLDLHLPSDQLANHRMLKHKTIPATLSDYFINGDYLLCDAIIKSIQLYYTKLIASDKWDSNLIPMFTKFFGLPMCEIMLSRIDSELLSNILLIWERVFLAITKKSGYECKAHLIKMCFESGIFIALWLLIKDEFVPSSVKIQASKVSQQLQKHLTEANIDNEKLLSIFTNSTKPVFSIVVDTDESDRTNNFNKSREQVIEEIFSQTNSLPTQDLLKVAFEYDGVKKVSKMVRPMEDVDYEELSNFLIHPIDLSNDDVDASSCFENFAILDDIISAKSFNTKIPSDCY